MGFVNHFPIKEKKKKPTMRPIEFFNKWDRDGYRIRGNPFLKRKCLDDLKKVGQWYIEKEEEKK